MTVVAPTLRCPCDRSHDALVVTYDTPPVGETRFDLKGQTYRRAFARCTLCHHWYAQHDLDLGGLYEGAYVSSTYGDRMRQTFERIMSLPPAQSDNVGRAEIVLAFAASRFSSERTPTLLDIGSGLAVFPAKMKQAGWRCTALDPDPVAARHAREIVGVDVVTGNLMDVPPERLGRHDVITFNKVLEHVEDPVGMLTRALELLAPGGFVYVEVPDGDAAASIGAAREEFFIEHHHVFSPASLALTAERAGLSVTRIERLREPSSKFTLRAFLVRPEAP